MLRIAIAILLVAVPAANQEASQTGPITEPVPVEKHVPSRDEVTEGCKKLNTPIVRFVVGTDGRPRNLVLLRSSGCGTANRKILAAVRAWVYKPATRDGQVIRRTVTSTIAWD
jgi:TonB family protein